IVRGLTRTTLQNSCRTIPRTSQDARPARSEYQSLNKPDSPGFRPGDTAHPGDSSCARWMDISLVSQTHSSRCYDTRSCPTLRGAFQAWMEMESRYMVPP